MITVSDLKAGSHFYFKSYRDGKVRQCRKNGGVKLWKTRPTHFQQGMKYGLKECFHITQDNAKWFFKTEAECAASATPPGPIA